MSTQVSNNITIYLEEVVGVHMKNLDLNPCTPSLKREQLTEHTCTYSPIYTKVAGDPTQSLLHMYTHIKLDILFYVRNSLTNSHFSATVPA